MGTFSIWHWIFVLLWFGINIPVVKVLQKSGRSGWWALVWLVPGVNLVGFWVFAFTRWPALDKSSMVTP